jgi:hypothetical protein
MLFMVSSLFFNGVHSFVPNPVYAQTNLVVTVTNACEFDDNDDPNVFGNCLTFEDGATISFDNVRFSASSNTPVKQFICKLERDGVPVDIDSDNSCTSNQITATATYPDLLGGNYQFTVTAIRDVPSQSGNIDEEESVTSSVFHFTVLSAGEGDAARLEVELQPDSLNRVGNTTLDSSFFDMISEGKTKFLSVDNIKPHTIIKPNTISCFSGNDGDYTSGSTIDDTRILQERNCDNIIVFEKNETEGKDSIRSQDPINSSKILTALEEGIDKPISSCAIGILDEGWVDLKGVKCDNLFIAYK